MQGRNEWFGILAVALLVLGLIGFQFFGGSDNSVGQAIESSIVDDAEPAVSDPTDTDRADTDLADNDQIDDGASANAELDTVIVYDRTIHADELPPEAIDTLVLIDQDGPFPYSKDGSTFQNREGLLPDHPRGWYREYTVETPGSDDRGARRIVGGDDGVLFWTDDHYDSFSQIVGW